MDRFWRFADRILLHPWTSRWGGFQTILGAGVLAAGLAGGSVSLVFGFSVAWAALTACGAALVASSAGATAIDRFQARSTRARPTAAKDDLLRSYRIAIREIHEELIVNRETVDEEPIKRGVNPTKPMRSHAWRHNRNALLEHPNPEPHRVGSGIYRDLYRAEEAGILFHNPSRPGQAAHTRVPIRAKLADALATDLDYVIRCFDEFDNRGSRPTNQPGHTDLGSR